MPTVPTILLFALIATTFVVVPGPSNLSVLSRGVGEGARMAIFGAAGCATGAALYVVATAAGLAAIIASSRPVFAALHYAGALYLLVLGVRVARSPPSLARGADAGKTTAIVAYRQGALVELSNPKVAVFFLALFPQFIHPGRGPAWSQIVFSVPYLSLLDFFQTPRMRWRPARSAAGCARGLAWHGPHQSS